ncbi:RNA polymerase sigma-70 factor (ECF subfamily) [Maricaulis maris]|uniref:RNA polymerase sigma-70 factor (ECF subfamily) n=1 Tax=Maricaulis maris TaxID=74318 RepID=A0A495DLE9_9PROT|nr:RNA polymerase sigma-70 factor (ECF subfamily) [Maricaulis maris]
MVVAVSDAFNVESLYREHGSRLRWIVRRIVKNPQDADDITQSAFERLLKTDVEARPVRDESAFLTTIATNLARNHLRHRNTVQRHSESVAHHYTDVFVQSRTPAESAMPSEAREQALQAAIRSLPPKCRTAFVLCKLKGLTYQQAAERMGVSSHMVKKHIQRGMALCAARLQSGDKPGSNTTGAGNDAG